MNHLGRPRIAERNIDFSQKSPAFPLLCIYFLQWTHIKYVIFHESKGPFLWQVMTR